MDTFQTEFQNQISSLALQHGIKYLAKPNPRFYAEYSEDIARVAKTKPISYITPDSYTIVPVATHFGKASDSTTLLVIQESMLRLRDAGLIDENSILKVGIGENGFIPTDGNTPSSLLLLSVSSVLEDTAKLSQSHNFEDGKALYDGWFVRSLSRVMNLGVEDSDSHIMRATNSLKAIFDAALMDSANTPRSERRDSTDLRIGG